MVNKIIPVLKKIYGWGYELLAQEIPSAHARGLKSMTNGSVQFDQEILLTPQLSTSLLGYKDTENNIYYLSGFSFFFVLTLCVFLELMVVVTILATLVSLI